MVDQAGSRSDATLTSLLGGLPRVRNVTHFRDLFSRVCTWNGMILAIRRQIIQVGQGGRWGQRMGESQVEMNSAVCRWLLKLVVGSDWFVILSLCTFGGFHNKEIKRDWGQWQDNVRDALECVVSP